MSYQNAEFMYNGFNGNGHLGHKGCHSGRKGGMKRKEPRPVGPSPESFKEESQLPSVGDTNARVFERVQTSFGDLGIHNRGGMPVMPGKPYGRKVPSSRCRFITKDSCESAGGKWSSPRFSNMNPGRVQAQGSNTFRNMPPTTGIPYSRPRTRSDNWLRPAIQGIADTEARMYERVPTSFSDGELGEKDESFMRRDDLNKVVAVPNPPRDSTPSVFDSIKKFTKEITKLTPEKLSAIFTRLNDEYRAFISMASSESTLNEKAKKMILMVDKGIGMQDIFNDVATNMRGEPTPQQAHLLSVLNHGIKMMSKIVKKSEKGGEMSVKKIAKIALPYAAGLFAGFTLSRIL